MAHFGGRRKKWFPRKTSGASKTGVHSAIDQVSQISRAGVPTYGDQFSWLPRLLFLEWLRPFLSASPRVQRFVIPGLESSKFTRQTGQDHSNSTCSFFVTGHRPTGTRQFRNARLPEQESSNRTARGTRTASGTSMRHSQVLHKTRTATPGEQQPDTG